VEQEGGRMRDGRFTPRFGVNLPGQEPQDGCGMQHQHFSQHFGMAKRGLSRGGAASYCKG